VPWHTGAPPQGFRCATNFYKKLCIHKLQLEKGNILPFVIIICNTHTGSSSKVLFNLRYILFSCACTLKREKI
jgi:hypothetical protein